MGTHQSEEDWSRALHSARVSCGYTFPQRLAMTANGHLARPYFPGCSVSMSSFE